MRVGNILTMLGHSRMILKSDQEPAIRALKEAAQADSSLKLEVQGRK